MPTGLRSFEYRHGAAGLITAIQDLSLAQTEQEVHRVALVAARRVTGADGSSLARRRGDRCHLLGFDGLAPNRGAPFAVDLSEDISGWSMTERRPAVVPDIRYDSRVPAGGYGPSLATSALVVPIRTPAPIGALANYWLGRHQPTDDEIGLLQALADSVSVALDNIAARAQLEARVRERTAELERVNARLHREIAERRRAEEEVRQLSLSDDLTGLYNRRGFVLLANRELRALRRSGRRAVLLYIDIDGLKETNDTFGHEAGDRLIVGAAEVLRTVARETDVVGRLGGDEFAVLMTVDWDHPPVHHLVERFLSAARDAGVRWSVGATASRPERIPNLTDLLAAADEAMYRGRRARRAPRPTAGVSA